jgi:hypothetical protein
MHVGTTLAFDFTLAELHASAKVAAFIRVVDYYFIVCFHEIPPIDHNPFRSLEYNHT